MAFRLLPPAIRQGNIDIYFKVPAEVEGLHGDLYRRLLALFGGVASLASPIPQIDNPSGALEICGHSAPHRAGQGVQIGVAMVQIRLQHSPFGPFVPGIHRHHGAALNRMGLGMGDQIRHPALKRGGG